MRINIDGEWVDTDDPAGVVRADAIEFGGSGIPTGPAGGGRATFHIGNMKAGAVTFGDGAAAGGVYNEAEDDD